LKGLLIAVQDDELTIGQPLDGPTDGRVNPIVVVDRLTVAVAFSRRSVTEE